MKPYAERELFILNYLRGRCNKSFTGVYNIDVLNTSFVDDYIAFTGASFQMMPFGANRCPTLGRDLSRMYQENRLRRISIGIPGMSGQGFPKWVWSYHL